MDIPERIPKRLVWPIAHYAIHRYYFFIPIATGCYEKVIYILTVNCLSLNEFLKTQPAPFYRGTAKYKLSIKLCDLLIRSA